MDKNYVAVAPKFFSVLEFLVRESGGQQATPVQGMVKELPFARTTLHRILYTLEKLGYVERADGRAHYRLGPKFFELTEPAVHFRQLLSVAKSVMVDLMIRFSETVNLGVLDAGQVAYIDVIQSPSSLRIAANPGDRNPVHSTSLGKALLAFMPDDEVESILEGHPPIKMTSKTITQKKHFMEHLASVREQGVAFDLEENVEGVVCIGAPIFDQRGRVVASLSVSGPAGRMEPKLAAIQEGVRNAGLKVSRMLGPRSVQLINFGKNENTGDRPSSLSSAK